MRLIDADAAVVRISKIVKNDWLMYEIKEVIKKIPAADVRERKTGKWIVDDNVRDALVWDYKCSECGYEFKSIDGVPYIGDMKFCPNCGARMVNVNV